MVQLGADLVSYRIEEIAPCCRSLKTTSGGVVMSRRKDAHIKEHEPALLAMQNAGCTQREISDYFGLEKTQLLRGISTI
jgi:hypothetical protein